MRERRRPYDDPEVLELLRDEPELLAIVDAIAATQVQRRRRVPQRLLLVAAVAGVVLVSIALVPWRLGGDGLSERALAAIGGARVVHVVASRPEPEQTLIDLATGTERSGEVRLETWFDSDTGDTRTTTRRNGEVVADTAAAGTASGGRDPAVSLFVRGYRPALERGEIAVLRRERLDGVDVVWVQVTLPSGRRSEVALDTSTDLPVAFRFAAEPASPLWRIESMDTLGRSKADFTTSQAPRGPEQGEIASARPSSPARAATVLEGHGTWPGPQFAGLHLEHVREQTLGRVFTDGRRETGVGVELLYRGAGSAFVRIRQATTPEIAYGFAEGRLTLDFAPIPKQGVLALTAPGSASGSLWRGQLRSNAVYLTILGSDRDLVLGAARTLVPLR